MEAAKASLITAPNPIAVTVCGRQRQSLQMNIVVDDTNPSLTYSGPWTLFIGGSSRQWESTVHSTTQTGASVSFKFQGSVCKVYGTVPIGNGATVLMDVSIDGVVSPIISRTTGSEASYANLFYQSSNMESTVWHTVVITNRGKAGNVDFQFDRVELDAPDLIPSVASFSPAHAPAPATTVHTPTPAPVPSPTQSHSNAPSSPSISLKPTSTIASITNTSSRASSSSQPQPTVMSSTSPSVLTQVVTTTRDDASQVSSLPDAQISSGPTHTFPIGIVIGVLGGIIALLILILILVLFLRRRRNNENDEALLENKETFMQDMYQDRTTAAIPFTVQPSAPFSDINAASAMSEKMLLQRAYANRSETDFGSTVSIHSSALYSTSNLMEAYPAAYSTSDGTASVSNFEAGTLSYSSESSSIPLAPAPAVYQSQSEPSQTDVKNEAACLRYISASSNAAPSSTSSYPVLGYLSGYSEAGPSTSAYGGANTESMYDMPPAYRPNR